VRKPQAAWTAEEIDRLRREYPVTTDSAALAASMGRSLMSIRVKAQRMKLLKDPVVISELCRRSMVDEETAEDDAAPRLEVLHAPEPGIVRIVRHRCR
jgi:hypothetical protein